MRPSRVRLSRLRDCRGRIQTLLQQGKRDEAVAVARRLLSDYVSGPQCLLKHPDEFQGLSGCVMPLGDEGMRDAVCTFWRRAYESDHRHRAAMSWRQAEILAGMLGAAAREQDLTNLARFLTIEFGERQGEKAQPDYLTSRSLRDLGRNVQVPSLANAAEARMASLCAGSAYPKNLSPVELRELAGRLRKAEGKDEACKLARFLIDEYLPQPGLADALRLDEWAALSRIVAEGGNESFEKQMAEMLRHQLRKRPEMVRALSQGQLRDTVLLASRLDTSADFSHACTAAWLGLGDTWQAVSPEEKALFVSAVIDDPAKGVTSAQALCARFAERQGKGELSPSECRAVWTLCRKLGASALSARWTRAARESFERTSPPKPCGSGDLEALLTMLAADRVKLSKEQWCRLFDGVVRCEGVGDSLGDSAYSALAGLCGPAGAGEYLQGRLFDGSGHVDLEAAKVCAWLRQSEQRGRRDDYRQLRAFVRQLTDMQERLKLAGDSLAFSKLAQAYAVSLIGPGINRERGSRSLDRALESAETEAVRLRCIREIVSAYRSRRVYDKPLAVIQECAAGMEGSSRQELAQLAKSLTDERAQYGSESERTAATKWRRQFDSRQHSTRREYVSEVGERGGMGRSQG